MIEEKNTEGVNEPYNEYAEEARREEQEAAKKSAPEEPIQPIQPEAPAGEETIRPEGPMLIKETKQAVPETEEGGRQDGTNENAFSFGATPGGGPSPEAQNAYGSGGPSPEAQNAYGSGSPSPEAQNAYGNGGPDDARQEQYRRNGPADGMHYSYANSTADASKSVANGKKLGNGFAIASLVLGVFSLVFFCTCFNVMTAVLAIIFGIIHLVSYEENGKGMAIGGIVTAGLSIVFTVVFWALILTSSAIGEFSSDPYIDDFVHEIEEDTMTRTNLNMNLDGIDIEML